MKEKTVKELMTEAVVTTTPETELVQAIQAMITHRYSYMLVVIDRHPIGIITERDIVRLMADYLNRSTLAPYRVVDVMTTPLVTVSEETPLFEAMVISTSQKIRHMPVIDSQGALIGLVTQTDLAQALYQILERQLEVIEAQVSERTKELAATNEQLKALSMIDPLLGIGNRRAMEVDLEYTHAQSLRYNRPYAVALFDVDQFKLYNDTYGHPAGDKALRQIADHFMSSIRTSDRVYRYGGEELLLLLPESSLQSALTIAERISGSLSDLDLEHAKSPHGKITVSGGVAGQPETGGYASWGDVVAIADQGLYQSKSNGRNLITAIAHSETGAFPP